MIKKKIGTNVYSYLLDTIRYVLISLYRLFGISDYIPDKISKIYIKSVKSKSFDRKINEKCDEIQ